MRLRGLLSPSASRRSGDPGRHLLRAGFFLLLGILPCAGSSIVVERDLFDDFQPGWSDSWMVKALASRATRFDAVTRDGETALRAASQASAAAFWRRLDVKRPTELKLSWRWRIDRGLVGNDQERTRQGDDYSARVLLTFGPGVFGRRTRALCYVWADGEPAGSVFPNPRTDNVATIVLQSGRDKWGSWVRERRDVLADYEAAFGAATEEVTAIAVIVDTDDTESAAVAWFDDVSMEYAGNAGPAS